MSATAVITPTLNKEIALFRQGYSFIAGLDEAGRGAWAGPVVAAAVILPLDNPNLSSILDGVTDSKKLTARQREYWFEVIQDVALSTGVGVTSHKYIDRYRIIAATRRAMHQALNRLTRRPDYLLIDALRLPTLPLPQQAFPKADLTSLSVAAASILAKVSRDRLMVVLDKRYPAYSFASHKGYGTKKHQIAIAQYGPCAIHRLSFSPFQPRLI